MSLHGFMDEGHRGHLLAEEKYLPHLFDNAIIKVFDIGEPNLFGAIYPDTARVAVPCFWFPTAQRKYELLKKDQQLFPPTPDGHPTELPKIRIRK